MKEITTIILNVAFTAFAVYGIYVLTKWKKAAQKVSKMCDEMYEDAEMHDPKGAWQMIFGVDTIPSYRRRGCAEQVLNRVIEDTRKAGRKGLVLTCKEHLVHYYAKFGFVSEGVSESTHGGVRWYQMRLTF
jgi:predicted GNAT family N-acyltransferase